MKVQFTTHGHTMKLVRPRTDFGSAQVFYDGELIFKRRGRSSLHVFERIEDGETVNYDVNFGHVYGVVRPNYIVVRRNGLVVFSNK